MAKTGLGKNEKKGGNQSTELYVLQLLNRIQTAIAGSSNGLATEATLISVLNAIISSPQDIEILLVRDTGNADIVLQQITDYSGGAAPVVTYKDVNGNVVTPIGPLEYLDPAGVLNLMLVELQLLNTTDFATAANQALALVELQSIVTNTTDGSTETTLASLLAAFSATDFATETTLATLAATDFATETTLSGAAADLLALLTAFNAEDFASETTLAALSTAFGSTDFATEATLSSLEGKDFATETTLSLVNSNIVLGNITLNNLLTAFNAEDFAQEVTLADLNSKFNTLGQKLSAASAPVVMSTEQEAIFNAIKTAVEAINIDTDGLAQETTLLATNALLTTIDSVLDAIALDTQQLDVDLSTRASEATLLLAKGVLDTIKTDTAAMAVDLAAIEVLLTTIDGVLDAIKLDTANLDVALSSRLNTLGRKPETASAPVVLSDEDFATLEAIRVAVQNLDVDVDGIATEVTLAALLTAFNNEDFASETTLASILACLCSDPTSIQNTLAGLRTDFNAEDFATQTTLQALLTAFNAEDFATQTTLAALLTAFNAENFATETTLSAVLTAIQALAFPAGLALEATQLLGNTTLASILAAITGEDFASETTLAALLLAFNGEDFATETTLAAIKAKTDQLLFDASSALNVVLPAGLVSSTYQVISGVGVVVIPPGRTSISCLSYGAGNCTVDTGLGPVNLASGIGLDFVAPVGKTLGAITFAGTIASSRLAITTVAN